MFIRTVRQTSGRTAIQVVEKIGRKNKLVKHIGTAQSPTELTQLKDRARMFINQERVNSGIISLFDSRFTKTELESLLARLRFTQALDTVTYRFLAFFYRTIGFHQLNNPCFADLVIARIVEPASKRKTRDILELRFGKKYSLSFLYRILRSASRSKYRETIEQIVHTFLTTTVQESLSVLFFDVTTLYFEAFDEDDTRKCGFSKDGKYNQPQIVIALMVTASGMPLLVRLFEGDTFEGHTMLPCVEEIKNKLDPDNLIIVADSAMLSDDNLTLLESKTLHYIVGARLANTATVMLKTITTTISRTDGAHMRLSLPDGRLLVVSYSEKRAAKDRSEREKQIAKAKDLLKNPGKLTRRYKFLSSHNKRYELNEKLIKKAELLEGLKGYVTNVPSLSDEEIIQKYASLWRVEKAFRMSKSDLKARPIFHTLKESIEAHLLIVFTALAISRHIEILTDKSIQHVTTTLSRIKEIIVEDPSTGHRASKFTNLTPEILRLLKLTDVRVT